MMNDKLSDKIQILPSEQIDFFAWDDCIRHSMHPLINSLSWYLNEVCENWFGLVVGQYEAVMALPFRWRYPLWVTGPRFSQQLGLFYKQHPDPELENHLYRFFNELVFFHYPFNTHNDYLARKLSSNIPRINYVLPLNGSYDALYKKFRNKTKQRIALSKRNMLELRCMSGIDVLNFKMKYPAKGEKVSFYSILPPLIRVIEHHLMGCGYGVWCDNECVAVAYFTRFENTIMYFLSASNTRGRELKAMFFLLDQIIQMHCDGEMVLDFEGSVVPSIAHFFSGFGAVPETYYVVDTNRNSLSCALKSVLSMYYRLKSRWVCLN